MNRLFTVNSFESDFPLVLDADGVKGKNVNMPDGIRYEFSVYQSRLKLGPQVVSNEGSFTCVELRV